MVTITTTTLTTHTTVCGVSVVWVLATETAVPLTRCCKAAVTGTSSGMVCKGCYRPAVEQDLHAALIAAGCPCPNLCEAETTWQIELAAGLHPLL